MRDPKSMKPFAILTLIILFALPATAQTAEDDLAQQYHEAGVKDAEALKIAYDRLHKPLYQQAYDDYLNDLELIAQTGEAQDNQALFRDILMMNSNEPFIYSHTEAEHHRFYNNVYQN